MGDVPHLIPPNVKRYLASVDRKEQREKEQRSKKLAELLATGKTEEALALLASDRSPVPERVEKLIERMEPVKLSRTVDRSAPATEKRQRELVEILTSGNRCSLSRAMRLVGYGKHRPSLDSLLASASILDLFAEAVAQGKELPRRYKRRIEAALAIAEDRALGIAFT